VATVRELVTRWGFNVDDRPLKRVDARIKGLKTSLRSLRNLTFHVTAGFAGLSAGIGLLLREAGDFEQIEIAFETLTQSQEKAKKLTSDLIMFAQKTPFQLKGVFDSTKQLLAYGIEAENMIDTLTALGNIAAGVGREKLPQLTLAFGQVRTAGRLRGQEVRQFTEAGVPIVEAIAKEMGVAATEVQNLVSKGEVGFDIVNKALQDLANGTGRFTGLMDKQSRTLLGLFSNLQDAVQVLAVTVGGALVPEAKEYLKIAIQWVEANKELIQQKTTRFIKILVKGMKQLVKVGLAVLRVLSAATKAVGGFENAVKLATTALVAFVAVRVLGFLGQVGFVALSAAKNLGVFIATTRTAALALFSLKLIALAIPLAIGAAIAALFLLIEDFVVFMQGGDSLIGSFVRNIDKAKPEFLAAIDNFGNAAIAKVQAFMDKFVAFLTDEQFAGQRKKIAEALLAALDIAITGSLALAKIGYKIGEVIVEGIAEAFVRRFPKLGALLGIQTRKQIEQANRLVQSGADTVRARQFIEKHGPAAAAGVFSPETIEKAQGLTERLKARGIDPSASREEILRKLMPGFSPKSDSYLLRAAGAGAGGTMLPAGFSSPVFKTEVKIEGSNLPEETLKRLVVDGVAEAHERTARDFATLTGAIKE